MTPTCMFQHSARVDRLLGWHSQPQDTHSTGVISHHPSPLPSSAISPLGTAVATTVATSYTIPTCMVQHSDHLLAWYPQPQQQARRHFHVISHQPSALPSSAIVTAFATALATAAFSRHQSSTARPPLQRHRQHHCHRPCNRCRDGSSCSGGANHPAVAAGAGAAVVTVLRYMSLGTLRAPQLWSSGSGLRGLACGPADFRRP